MEYNKKLEKFGNWTLDSFLLRCRAHCEDGDLRRVDDGCELVDAEHAQVRYGEGAALD